MEQKQYDAVLLANYRSMKCTEDICVFSKDGAAAASKHKGNMTYNAQSIKKENGEKRILVVYLFTFPLNM